jgi:hypothetical protein
MTLLMIGFLPDVRDGRSALYRVGLGCTATGRRFHGRQFRRRFPVISPGSPLDSEDAVPPLDDVEIQFEDPPLAQVPLDPPGEDGLPEFPDGVFGGGEVEVFDELLADGAPPELPSARLEVFFRGLSASHRNRIRCDARTSRLQR